MSAVAPLVSPDGRWLTLTLWQGERIERRRVFLLYDLRRQETRLLSTTESSDDSFLAMNFDWSADGEWLARLTDGAVDLIRPGLEREGGPYRRVAFHDYESCSYVAWINR
jgi:hypothetical protein